MYIHVQYLSNLLPSLVSLGSQPSDIGLFLATKAHFGNHTGDSLNLILRYNDLLAKYAMRLDVFKPNEEKTK